MTRDLNVLVDNLLVKGVLESPEAEKLMILVHGFTGDLRGPDNIFVKLSQKLQGENYAVIRFSFRGTPPSEGDFCKMTVGTETQDFIKVIEYAQTLGYLEIGVLGESMGGTIITYGYDPLFKVAVFWYPCFNFVDTAFKKYLTEESQRILAEQGFLLEEEFKVGRQFINEIPGVNLFSKVSEIKCPTLFLHGNQDSEVPYQQSEKAFQMANKPKEIHLIKGADHCFGKEQDEAIDLTLDFIKRYF